MGIEWRRRYSEMLLVSFCSAIAGRLTGPTARAVVAVPLGDVMSGRETRGGRALAGWFSLAC